VRNPAELALHEHVPSLEAEFHYFLDICFNEFM
jgi:hypothetical protein